MSWGQQGTEELLKEHAMKTNVILDCLGKTLLP